MANNEHPDDDCPEYAQALLTEKQRQRGEIKKAFAEIRRIFGQLDIANAHGAYHGSHTNILHELEQFANQNVP
jgi:hypothetical protein